jgi:cystathionine beta-lyase
MAAMDAVLKLLNAGDEVVATNDLYGGSYRIITKIYERFGLKGHFVPMYDAAQVEQYLTKNTKLLWIETPTNPMLNIVDIEAICKLAKSKGILTCVDNTFASPYLQNPLDLGADLVVHSATKYLGGHSDTVLGAVVAKEQELADRLHFIQNASGGVPGPAGTAGLRKCREDRPIPESPPKGAQCLLPRLCRPPRPCGGQKADAPFRGDGFF